MVLSFWYRLTRVVAEKGPLNGCVCASVGGGAGFSSFDTEDQITIVRLGQSSSRVLVAALHWYDADRRTFRNFLSWRAGGAERGRTATGLDLFKQQLVRFSETVIALELDPVEAAMLNVLLVTASGMRTARSATVVLKLAAPHFPASVSRFLVENI